MSALRTQVEQLKADWLAAPEFGDITEGCGPEFAEYMDELNAVQRAAEARWAVQLAAMGDADVRTRRRALDLGCTFDLARYIGSLEARIAVLEGV